MAIDVSEPRLSAPGGGPTAFSEALARAIADRGLSLTTLARRLADSGNPVSRATLSYWRTGERTPEGAQSMAAIAELERLLRREPDDLLRLVPEGHRVGPVRDPVIPAAPDELAAFVQETMDALDAAPQSSFREVTAQVVADVDAEGAVARLEVRTMIQATSAVVQRLPFVIYDESPPSEIDLVALRGCDISLEYRHPSGLVLGYVITLEYPIVARETAMIEFAIGSPDPGRMLDHTVAREIRHLVLWARFTPGSVPDEYIEFEALGDEEAVEQSPKPIAGASVLVERRAFGPGWTGFRW